jgi:copper chaperone CopZ
MKNTLPSCLLALTLASFVVGCTPHVTIVVPDMMCEEGCAAKVNEVLRKQPGVKSVDVDFANKSATVSIDDKVFDSNAAVAALVDHGFDHSTLKDSAAASSAKSRSADSGASN